MELRQALGRNVLRNRLARGLSIEALAHDAGLSYSYVGQIERGRRNPTLSVIEALATALGVSADNLLKL